MSTLVARVADGSPHPGVEHEAIKHSSESVEACRTRSGAACMQIVKVTIEWYLPSYYWAVSPHRACPGRLKTMVFEFMAGHCRFDGCFTVEPSGPVRRRLIDLRLWLGTGADPPTIASYRTGNKRITGQSRVWILPEYQRKTVELGYVVSPNYSVRTLLLSSHYPLSWSGRLGFRTPQAAAEIPN